MSFQSRFRNWQITQRAQEHESNRINFLKTAALPQNQPGLFHPTKVRVLKSFCINGKPVEVGTIISLPWHDAESLKAIGKCEIIQ